MKHIILIGEAKEKIKKDLEGLAVPTVDAGTMEDAVSLARQNGRAGDTILLSPMCSSFDMFKDYKERGEAFGAAVLEGIYKASESAGLLSK